MTGRLVDYIASGLDSGLPAAATVDGNLTGGAAGFYYATDTQKLYCLDRSGTPSWDALTVAAGGTAWGAITGTLSDQTDLQSALNGKANTSHTHAISDVTNLQTSLDAKLNASAVSTFGGTLIDDADAATARTTLGLGTIATQAASSVSITGGSIAGITDLAVADGGTGASNASGARANLGLGTVATLDSDTDTTLAANSDSKVATQKAIKAYVDALGVRFHSVRISLGNPNAITIPVNSASYIRILNGGRISIDLDKFRFSHFRIQGFMRSTETGQTVTLQLTESATPTTPTHTGGDDLVLPYNGGLGQPLDSGWRSRDDGYTTGIKEYAVAGKGSNSTVDIVADYIDVQFYA